MVLPRPAIFRASFASAFARPVRNTTSRQWQRVTQSTSRRGYASAQDVAKKAGGDLPWAVGAVVVTVPGLYWVLGSEGHGHASSLHDEKHHPEKHQTAEGDEGKSNIEPSKDKDQLEKPQNEPAGDEAATKDEQHEVKGPESKGDTEDVKFKGPSKAIDEGEVTDTRKHVPDAKGGAKKRIEGGYGTPVGEGDKAREGEEGKAADKAASSKESGDWNTTSGKQAGLSNTDTKHSSDIASSPEKSTKGEGTVDSAKVAGSVKPDRPPAENKEERGIRNA